MPPKDILEPMGIYDERVDKLCSRQFNELDKLKVDELLSYKIMNSRSKLHCLSIDDNDGLLYDSVKLIAFEIGFLQARNIILNYLENGK